MISYDRLRVFTCIVPLLSALASCVGTADMVIYVQGRIVDGDSRDYEICTVSVYEGNFERLVEARIGARRAFLCAIPSQEWVGRSIRGSEM